MTETPVIIKLIHETCCNCGMPFGIESSVRQRFLSTREYFCCPAGHRQQYRENTETRLRRELAAKERDVEYAKRDAENIRAQRDIAYKQNDYSRRLVTRRTNELKKAKIKAVLGKCPCCSEQFSDVQSHMATAHPNVKADLREEFKFIKKESEHEVT